MFDIPPAKSAPWQLAQVVRFVMAAVMWEAGSQLATCFPVSELKYDWLFGSLHPNAPGSRPGRLYSASGSFAACFAPLDALTEIAGAAMLCLQHHAYILFGHKHHSGKKRREQQNLEPVPRHPKIQL
jgi:hypothetical protein